MKKIKSILCLLWIAALLLSFTGCAPATTEDVLLKLTENIDGREPTAATVTLDMAMTAEISGQTKDVTVYLKNRTLTASETDSYAEGEFAYGINTQKIRDGSQVYNFAEDGKLLTFTHVDSTDRWFRSETDLPEQSQPAVTPEPSAAPDPQATEDTEPSVSEEATAEVTVPEEYQFLTLEAETRTLNNLEMFVLTGTVDGDVCKDLLLDSLNLDALTARLQKAAPEGTDLSTINFKNLDFSALTADVTVYLNKESCELTQVELILNGMNLLVGDFMTMLPEQVSSLLGTSVTIEPIQVVFSDISFDPVSIPEITEEIRILAMQESFNPDQGDGTYILQQYGDCVKLTAQTDWTATELGYCFAGFRNADNTRSVNYELYRSTTPDTFIKQVESGMIPAMEAKGLTVTTAAGEAIGEYQTYSISGNGLNVYLACRTVGNSLLGIYAEDSTGADLVSVLDPILSAVEDHNLEF